MQPPVVEESVPEQTPEVGIHQKGHNMLTHFPMDPKCPICQNSKLQHAPHISSKRKADRFEKEPINAFGELTADHAILGSGEPSRNGDQVCLMVFDRFTGWMVAYSSKTKDAETVADSFRNFYGDKKVRSEASLYGWLP